MPTNTAGIVPLSSLEAAFAQGRTAPPAPNVSEALDTSDPAAISSFARILREARYPSGGDEALGRELASLHRKRDLPLFLRRLKDQPTLQTLCRLFAFQESVSAHEARAAFGALGLEAAEALGLVQVTDSSVEPRVAISVCDGLFILHDPALSHSGGRTHPDHVLGVSPPTLLLASLTLRRPAALALDLGTGCGVQALLMASHCRKVIGTDINPRGVNFARFNALLNGIENVEFRFGSLFEPLGDLKFDLIVTNPPYVISPESHLMFRDGGSAADGFCAKLVRALPERLTEGGFACLLANWAHFQEEHWSAPVRSWLEGSACDAWILHGHDHEPLSYAADWNRHLDTAAFASALDEWGAYYEHLGIRSITSGGLVIRQRSGAAKWIRAGELGERTVPLSAAIESVFAAEDFLTTHSDQELLALRFALRPSHQIVQTIVPEDGDYIIREMRLETNDEPKFRASLDTNTFQLLRRCNGRQTLRETLAEITQLAGGDPVAGLQRGLTIVRGLLAHGVLMPCAE